MREHYRSIPVPKSSPWGPVQGGEEIAPGIVSVWSAGHGGIGISDERASDMLSSLRCIGQESTFHKGYDRGFVWFEEDCEWAAVAVSFPEHFTASLDAAWATLRRYYPGIAPSTTS